MQGYQKGTWPRTWPQELSVQQPDINLHVIIPSLKGQFRQFYSFTKQITFCSNLYKVKHLNLYWTCTFLHCGSSIHWLVLLENVKTSECVLHSFRPSWLMRVKSSLNPTLAFLSLESLCFKGRFELFKGDLHYSQDSHQLLWGLAGWWKGQGENNCLVVLKCAENSPPSCV